MPLAFLDDFPAHLLLPLTSSVVYVAAALSLKRASVHGAGVWRSTFVMNLAVALCFSLMLLDRRPGTGPMVWWQPAVIGTLFVGGQALTMIALSRGDVSVATPVMGTKVIFVAFFVTLIVGDRLIADYWVSAGMSAVGIALLNLGGGGSNAGGGEGDAPVEVGAAATGRHPHLLLTIVASLSAAACYALFDVLVRKWAGAWGVGRLLPAVMACASLMSLGLWPAFEGPLGAVPRTARGPLLLGSALIGVQALLLVRTLGLYPDTTRINVVYNSRGLWSVLAVWLVGHWWGNTERHAGRAVLAWRLGGAALLLGAIVIAVVQPIDARGR
jgi:drug/metabolite transporter (DMT)-like permease